MTDDDLVPFQGFMVKRSTRDRLRATAADAIAECRRILAAGRPAEEVARDRARQEGG